MSERTLLVVDDDRDVRELLQELLELEGFRVLPAEDGREALALLRQGPPPDAILLDLRMPGMNGREFRAHQLAEPALADVPVYILTADRTQDAETTAQLKPAGFFHKPLDIDEMLEALQQLPVGPGPSRGLAPEASALA